MSSLDTDLVEFCNPHWEFVCCNKWLAGTLEISAPQEIAVRTNFHAWHGTEITPVFLIADREASWLLLPSLVSLVSGHTVQPKKTYSCICKVTVQVSDSQKG